MNWLNVQGLKIRYFVQGEGNNIVFLHGYSFNIETWLSINVIEELSKNYKVFAIDMPYGLRSKSDKFYSNNRDEYADFLNKIFLELNIISPIIIGASISGEVTLRYILRKYDARAAVVIAPSGISEIEEKLSEIKIPLLIVWGDKDDLIPLRNAYILKEKVKNSQLKIINNAKHACYLDKPDEFKGYLKEFLLSLEK